MRTKTPPKRIKGSDDRIPGRWYIDRQEGEIVGFNGEFHKRSEAEEAAERLNKLGLHINTSDDTQCFPYDHSFLIRIKQSDEDAFLSIPQFSRLRIRAGRTTAQSVRNPLQREQERSLQASEAIDDTKLQDAWNLLLQEAHQLDPRDVVQRIKQYGWRGNEDGSLGADVQDPKDAFKIALLLKETKLMSKKVAQSIAEEAAHAIAYPDTDRPLFRIVIPAEKVKQFNDALFHMPAGMHWVEAEFSTRKNDRIRKRDTSPTLF